MCGTSPCETLEEQCVLLVVSSPKSIDQEAYQIDLYFWLAYRVRVLYCWKTVENLKGREEQNIEKDWVS